LSHCQQKSFHTAVNIHSCKSTLVSTKQISSLLRNKTKLKQRIIMFSIEWVIKRWRFQSWLGKGKGECWRKSKVRKKEIWAKIEKTRGRERGERQKKWYRKKGWKKIVLKKQRKQNKNHWSGGVQMKLFLITFGCKESQLLLRNSVKKFYCMLKTITFLRFAFLFLNSLLFHVETQLQLMTLSLLKWFIMWLQFHFN